MTQHVYYRPLSPLCDKGLYGCVKCGAVRLFASTMMLWEDDRQSYTGTVCWECGGEFFVKLMGT